jgi:hypothetical protein
MTRESGASVTVKSWPKPNPPKKPVRCACSQPADAEPILPAKTERSKVAGRRHSSNSHGKFGVDGALSVMLRVGGPSTTFRGARSSMARSGTTSSRPAIQLRPARMHWSLGRICLPNLVIGHLLCGAAGKMCTMKCARKMLRREFRQARLLTPVPDMRYR